MIKRTRENQRITKAMEREALGIARNIHRLRLARGLSLDELAVRMGISEGALSEVEKGRRWRVQWLNLLNLARALECQPSEILSPPPEEDTP
jgi:DNA-binding Xre family transcriptional regulator